MRLELVRCLDEGEWDRWVADSPQGSPFCSSWFLRALEVGVEKYFLLEDGEPVLGGMLFRRDGRVLRAPLPSCFYQGLLFRPSKDVPPHRKIRKNLEWTQAFLENLKIHSEALSFCLHPQSPDIRGFSWFHYNEPEKGQFTLQPRYTGIVDLEPFESSQMFLLSVRELRRREYLKSEKSGCRVVETCNEEILVSLFRETFARQGLVCSSDQIGFVARATCAAVRAKVGRIFQCESADGEVLSAALFLHDARTAYYLFGGNSDKASTFGSGTRVMVDAFFESRSRGCMSVDLLGLNSPGRGDFKASFNALPSLYFHAHWEKPSRAE